MEQTFFGGKIQKYLDDHVVVSPPMKRKTHAEATKWQFNKYTYTNLNDNFIWTVDWCGLALHWEG